jgi:hypothetical protein
MTMIHAIFARARVLTGRIPAQTQLAALWLCTLGLAEVGLRLSPNDAYDGLAVGGLLAVIGFTVGQHSREQVTWISKLDRMLRLRLRKLSNWQLDIGVDLRIAPPVPRGLPMAFFSLAFLASLGTLFLWQNRGLFPGDARDTLRMGSGALWLLALTVFWCMTGGAVLMVIFAVPMFVHERFNHSTRYRDGKRVLAQAAVVMAFWGGIVIGMWKLPAWLPLAMIVGGVLISAPILLLPGRPALAILWRHRSMEGARSVDYGTIALTNLVSLGGLVAVPYLLGNGDQLGAVEPGTTRVTSFFALAYGWTGVILYCSYCCHVWKTFLVGRWLNPAKRWAARVQVSGQISAEARRCLEEALSMAGVDLMKPGSSALPGAVEIEYLPLGSKIDIAWQEAWPLQVGPEDLLNSPVALNQLVQRIQRRDQILRRRQLNRGLKRLFKLARQSKPDEGGGYWLAPHQWFISRLSRDGNDGSELTQGPAYHPTLPIRARAHLYEVMGGSSLDLIFVADGVSFRQLQRVLAMLFEFHDMFGGGRLAEERHFSGLPGIRVIIIEQDLTRKRPTGRYPEPDFEGLGRSRILHIFKDSYGGEDQLDVPLFPEFVFEPSLR